MLSVAQPNYELRVPTDGENLDGLNFLAGKRVDEVNKMAELGTQLAHVDGGVPNIKFTIDRIDEYHIGQLIYMFEKGCGISGLLLEVNPFDQPGKLRGTSHIYLRNYHFTSVVFLALF